MWKQSGKTNAAVLSQRSSRFGAERRIRIHENKGLFPPSMRARMRGISKCFLILKPFAKRTCLFSETEIQVRCLGKIKTGQVRNGQEMGASRLMEFDPDNRSLIALRAENA
ncbi:hypothetical protein EVAR_17383_1 [Eumeta japonica]|uniref:Uncharacterized protein n=1 Tax=Eumeta variegata TaxID=151549 RepID=A0A4C1VB04_EUMVA|nr:hypothetical protein EVAR_17383_1 [Eumeta japonica]